MIDDGDKAHARFHQTARQQQLTANRPRPPAARIRHLVQFHRRLAFAIERKGLPRLVGTDQLIGLAVKLVHGIEFAKIRFHLPEMVLHGLARRAPCGQALRGDARRQRNIPHLEILPRYVAA